MEVKQFLHSGILIGSDQWIF